MLNYQNGLDRTFRALADPARRAMLNRLARGTASVSELAAPLEMSLPAVVQHLAVLEDSGLIRTTKQGRSRMCQIEPRNLRAAQAWIAERCALWNVRLDSLERFLSDPEPRKIKRRPRR